MLNLSQPPVNIESVEIAAPFSWLPVIVQAVLTIATVVITGYVTWRVARWRYNQDRNDLEESEQNMKARHQAELDHQRELHEEQLRKMAHSEKRQRQAEFIRSAASDLAAISARAKHDQLTIEDAIRLTQLSLEVRPDFDQDADAFAYDVAHILKGFATSAEDVVTRQEADDLGPKDLYRVSQRLRLEKDSAELAFHMVRWFHPGIAAQAGRAIRNYRETGEFHDPNPPQPKIAN
ncbi:hypothetical protein GCM10022261_23640 [Brevibacterium daeguense]|uniref:DUF4760 domain-containing protein n=1 Tax=Brevibacterium daeguense TaxID=909936 RepID=A0ABP8ELK1_9MICO|nr:DUF4670 domain-containing protein [Brevibacterium daeguense]